MMMIDIQMMPVKYNHGENGGDDDGYEDDDED